MRMLIIGWGGLYLWFHWDFEKAEQNDRRAKELNPALALFGASSYYQLATGRFQEALENSFNIIRSDPRNSTAWLNHALCHQLLKNEHKANEAIDKALSIIDDEPDSYFGGEWLRILVFQGKYTEVVSIYESKFKDVLNARHLSIAAIGYHHTGRSDRVKDILEQLAQFSERSPLHSPAFYSAMVYAQMGEIDTAFEWLEKAYQDHEVEMYWLKVEPPFEPLRSDPRWEVMLDKVGFPE